MHRFIIPYPKKGFSTILFFRMSRRFVHPGLFSRSSKRSRKADIPRDVSCDANTYRLFTRPAIFEAIRQSDIRESFVMPRRSKVAAREKEGEDAFCPAIPFFLSSPAEWMFVRWTRVAEKS